MLRRVVKFITRVKLPRLGFSAVDSAMGRGNRRYLQQQLSNDRKEREHE